MTEGEPGSEDDAWEPPPKPSRAVTALIALVVGAALIASLVVLRVLAPDVPGGLGAGIALVLTVLTIAVRLWLVHRPKGGLATSSGAPSLRRRRRRRASGS